MSEKPFGVVNKNSQRSTKYHQVQIIHLWKVAIAYKKNPEVKMGRKECKTFESEVLSR